MATLNDEGVTISFKEIYEEQKKTSKQLDNLNIRMERIEQRLEIQDTLKMEFSQKVKIASLSALIPIVLGIFIYVAQNGGL